MSIRERTATPPTTDASAMTLLEGGIPLSLLLDLVCAPDSTELFDTERSDTTWIR